MVPPAVVWVFTVGNMKIQEEQQRPLHNHRPNIWNVVILKSLLLNSSDISNTKFE